MSKYKGIAIRSKKTRRVFRVLDQRGWPETELLVKLIHSPQEEQPHVHEPFWLDHFEWEEVEHHELNTLGITES